MDRPPFNGSPPIANDATPDERKHGQAALLLVESLMHTLLNKGVITQEEFIDTVDGAAEVEHELIKSNGASRSVPAGSLLHPLAAVFRKDLGR